MIYGDEMMKISAGWTFREAKSRRGPGLASEGAKLQVQSPGLYRKKSQLDPRARSLSLVCSVIGFCTDFI